MCLSADGNDPVNRGMMMMIQKREGRTGEVMTLSR